MASPSPQALEARDQDWKCGDGGIMVAATDGLAIGRPIGQRGRMRILGAVMAGGASRRFGSDKAGALLGGRSLLDRAADAIGPCVAAVVVCGRRHGDYPGLDDRPGPGMGPLGGLNAALHHAAQTGFDGVLSTGCDMPIFPVALAGALIGADAAVVEGQFLMGYWPAGLAPRLDEHLRATPDRSIRAWLEIARPRLVVAPALPNINTPADLAMLAAHYG